MRIAILASEGAPYVKSGGLGDVMEALPSALARIEGNEVLLLLPYYKKIRENPKYETEQRNHYHVSLGWRQQYAGIKELKGRTDGVRVCFIDNLYYFDALRLNIRDRWHSCQRSQFVVYFFKRLKRFSDSCGNGIG